MSPANVEVETIGTLEEKVAMIVLGGGGGGLKLNSKTLVPVYRYVLINRFQYFAIETLCVKTLKFSTSNNLLLAPLD